MKYLFFNLILMFMAVNYSYKSVNYISMKFDEMPKDVQHSLFKTGLNDSIGLNQYEIKYFKALFGDSLSGFEFTDKKIYFMRSKGKSTKKSYFNSAKEESRQNTVTQTFLLILTDEQKEQTGYDAVIQYWYKHVIMSDEELIRRLKGTDDVSKKSLKSMR